MHLRSLLQKKKFISSTLSFWMVLAFFLFFTKGEGRNYESVWPARFLCITMSILIVFCIYNLGRPVLRFFVPSFHLTTIALSFGLGTFFFCLFTLVLGSLGWLNQITALLILLLINGLSWRGLIELWEYLQHIVEHIRKIQEQRIFSLRMMIMLAFGLLFINGMHAFLPPLDYDVLEYHLGAPAEYYKEGKIFFLANNVYANFPQNMEMIAFFSICLCGKLYGAVTANIVLWVYGIFLLLAIYLLAKKFVSKEAAIVCACLVCALPWTAHLLRIYYVEIPLAFFLVLTFLLFYSSECSSSEKRYLLLGILLGIASGIKYTAIFMGLIAFLPLIWSIEGSYRFRLVRVSFILAGFLIGFAPWGIRNYLNTGNPFYPLWNLWIIPGYWTEWMYARFRQAHAPSSFSLLSMGNALWKTFITGSHCSLLHCVMLGPAILFLIKKFRSMGYFIGIWVFLWLIFTHRIERFIYIVWVLLCLPMGVAFLYLEQNLPGKAWKTLLFFLSLVTIYHQSYFTVPGAYDYILGMRNKNQLLQEHYLPYKIEEFINTKVKEKVLMIGEARVFYLDVPVVANTVFDRNLLEEMFHQYDSPSQVAAALKRNNIRYLYFNWNELARLTSTYSFTYQGRTLPGYFWVDRSQLLHFLQEHCIRIFPDRKEASRETMEVYYLREE